MKILIVEDDRPTAEDIQCLTSGLLKKSITSIHIETTLNRALEYISENPVDLLLLDLNLNEKDGFQIIQRAASGAFHTIVISANIHRAIEAFEYGVLDFIPKPYNIERLKTAFGRLGTVYARDIHSIKYLSVKRGHEIKAVPISDVHYFKSANVYSELHLKDENILIYDKSFKMLEPLLSSSFIRIHKSYIINRENIDKILTLGGGQYRAVLKTGERLPVSRQKINMLKEYLDL